MGILTFASPVRAGRFCDARLQPPRENCYRRRVPTPLGHALGGIAAGYALAGRRAWSGRSWVPLVWFALLGMAADLDLLVGRHSRETHSVGAAVAIGLAALSWLRRDPRWAVAASGAYASHPLLDWLGSDTSPPIGIMAFWPMSREHVQSTWFLFPAVPRDLHWPGFWQAMATALTWELLLLSPAAAAALWVARRGRHNAAPPPHQLS